MDERAGPSAILKNLADPDLNLRLRVNIAKGCIASCDCIDYINTLLCN